MSASPPNSTSTARRVVPLAAWVCTLAVAMGALARYHGTPGDPGAIPTAWPASETRLAPGGFDVLLFVHPRCPCTIRSIDALARVVDELRRAGHQVGVRVIVRTPADGSDDAWRSTPTVSRLDRLGDHTTEFDPGGTIAARWNAVTSGHVAVFGRNGTRLLDGGLTPARSHAEDPFVLSTIAARLHAGESVDARPVFGCPIPDPPAAATTESSSTAS